MKRISVIIPVYNAEKYLAKCVDSVINQTYPVFEIIVINDGSTDNSKTICNALAEKDSRIRVIDKSNEGVSVARNIGLQVATGDLISFIDSDDALELDMYEYLVNLLEEHNADIAHCGYKRLDEENHILNECNGSHIIIQQTGIEAIEYMLKGKYFVGGLWNKMFKHSILNGIHFEEQLKNNEDILFSALAFQNAMTTVFGDETKYLYYEHSTSACNTLEEAKKSQDSICAAKILLQNCKTEDMRSVALRWLFLIELSSYKTGIINQKNNDQEKKDWLKENHRMISGLCLNDKLNYYLSIYCPHVFKIIYSFHKRISQPKWDPET